MLYHVTTADALASILEKGILPRVGPRSAELGEKEPAVYAFTSLDAVEDALCGWLGEAMPQEAELVVIEIDMDAPLAHGSFEVAMKEAVPPASIVRILDESLAEQTALQCHSGNRGFTA